MKKRQNPYVGPRALEREDGIYGRGREIRRLLNTIFADRIVLLHAPSGAGKTSLIQAGLIPAVEEEGLEVLPPMRVNLEPGTPDSPLPEAVAGMNRYLLSLFISLESAFAPTEDADGDTDSEKLQGLLDEEHSVITRLQRVATPLSPEELVRFPDLESYLQERWAPLPTGQDQLLIFDQFEEILTVAKYDVEGKWAFFNAVGQALRSRNRYALFVSRDEYLAPLRQYARAIPSRFQVLFALDLLAPSDAVDAVREPASSQDVEFERDAAAKLVKDLRQVQEVTPSGETVPVDGPFVEPVQLQVVCRNLWAELESHKALDDNVISLSDLAGAKDVSTALGDYYADCVKKTAENTRISERRLRQWIEKQLITGQGIRKQVLVEPIASAGMETRALLQLREMHVLRIERRHSASWFELAHDRMVPPVRANNEAWFEKNLSTLQLQAAIWDRQKRPNELLLRDRMLDEAETWSREHPDEMGEVDTLFLERSRQERDERLKVRQQRELDEQQQEMARQQRELEQQRKAFRRVLGLSILLGIFFIVGVVLAVVARSQAEQADIARATAESALVDAQLAREDAEDAANTAQTAQAEEALARADAVEALSVAQTAQAQEAVARADAEQALSAAQTARAEEAVARATAEAALSQAEANARLAEARRLAFVSESLLDSNRSLSLLLAGQALRTSPGGDAESAIRRALEGTVGEQINEADPAPAGISTARFSAGGELLIVLAQYPDGTQVELWPTGGGERVWSSPDRYPAASAVALSPDNRFLALAADTRRIIIWEIGPGWALDAPDATEQVKEVGEIDLVVADVTALAWVKGGTQLAAGDDLGGVWFWQVVASDGGEAPKDEEDQVEEELFFEIRSAGGLTETIQSMGNAFPFQEESISAMTPNGDGSFLALGTASGSVGAVQLADRGPVALVPAFGLPGAVTALAFLQNGMLVSGDDSGEVYLWQLGDDASQVQVAQAVVEGESVIFAGEYGRHDGAVTALAVSDFGDLLATAGADGTARLWAASSLYELASFSTGGAVNAVSFNATGERLVAASDDASVVVWDTFTNRALVTLDGHGGPVRAAAFSPLEPLLLISAGDDGALWKWRLEGSDEATVSLEGHQGEVFGLAFIPSEGNSLLASADSEGDVILWDADAFYATGDESSVLLRQDDYIGRVAWHPDGDLVVYGGIQGFVHVVAVDDGEWAGEVARLASGKSAIFGPLFSPNGTWLVTGDFEGRLFLWDVADVRQGDDSPLVELELPGEPREIFTVAFSRDSRLLALTTTDLSQENGQILIYDVASLLADGPNATPVWRLQTTFVLAMAFDEQRDVLYAGDEQGMLYAWDVSAEQPDAEQGPVLLLELVAHGDLVADLAVEPAGRWLASVSNDGTARIWRVTGDESELNLDLNRELFEPTSVSSVAFSSNGRYLALGRGDGQVRLELSDSVEQLLDQACRVAERNLRYDEWIRYVDPAEMMPYEVVCAGNRLPDGVIASLVARGIALSEAGDTDDGLRFLQRAVALDGEAVVGLPGVDGAAIVADAVAFVERQRTLGLVFQATALARTGDVEGATALLSEAIASGRQAVEEVDPSIVENPERYAGVLAVPALLETGRSQAGTGDVEGALDLFARALEYDPDIVAEIDPDVFAEPGDVALQLALPALIDLGRDLTSYARPLPADGVATGLVQPDGGQLWSFSAEVGQVAIITLNSRDGQLDPFIYLVDPDGAITAQNDDFGDSRDSRLLVSLRTSGEYIVLARGYGTSSGEYELGFQTALSFESMIGELGVDELVELGMLLAESGEVDEATTYFEAAVEVEPALVDPAITADPRTYALRAAIQGMLFDETRMTEDGFLLLSTLAREVADPYLAYLVCFSGVDQGAGDDVAEICQFAATLTAPIRTGQTVSGTVALRGGEAWSFEGRAGDRATISMTGIELDTYLTLLGPDNVVLSYNDDFESTDSQIGPLELPVDGTYVILSHGFGDSSGDYELTLAIEPR